MNYEKLMFLHLWTFKTPIVTFFHDKYNKYIYHEKSHNLW